MEVGTQKEGEPGGIARNQDKQKLKKTKKDTDWGRDKQYCPFLLVNVGRRRCHKNTACARSGVQVQFRISSGSSISGVLGVLVVRHFGLSVFKYSSTEVLRC